MHKLSRPLQGHARLKVRAAVGSALPRRRFQATQARSAAAATDAAPVAGTSDSIKSLLRAYNPKEEIRVPAPLHPEQRRTSLTQHTVYPASATIEQLSMLEVCLATGNVTRARKIYAALANLYAKEAASAHAASEDYDDFDPVSGQWRKAVAFSDVIPTTIHAQFLRAYFRQAIVNDRAAQAIVNDQASANDKASGNDKASVKDKASGKDKASVKDKKTTAKDKASGNNKASVNDNEAIAKDEASTNDTADSKDKATEEGKPPVKSKTGYILKKKASVAQAWEWFDMVLQNERQYGRMDDSAWAVMFKGMVA